MAGAYRQGAKDLITQQGYRVPTFPNYTLGELFDSSFTDWRISQYLITDPDSGEIRPWFRFGKQVHPYSLGIFPWCCWVHLEYDLPKIQGVKEWQGLVVRAGKLKATTALVDRLFLLVDPLISHLGGASWYASRGGIHVVKEITPIAYSDFSAYVRGWFTSLPDLPGLTLDTSCAEVSRLQAVPSYIRDGVMLDLPRQLNPGEVITLPAPSWAPKAQAGINLEEIKIPREFRAGLKRFFSNWIGSHVKWLETALPGSGRNARLYAAGGDIRQAEAAGVLEGDATAWLDKFIRLGENAPVAPVHSAQEAVMNGYSTASTDTIARGIASCEQVAEVNRMVKKYASKAQVV